MMTKQRESRISGEILNALRINGYFAFKVHGSEVMMKGLPDIIVCARGMFIGLETKVPEKRGNVSEAQRRVHELIEQAEGQVEVVCGVAEALEKVRSMIGEDAPLIHPKARRGPMIHD